jgi:cellulose synthase/poly-beta-1,6-N-acetylglucosamine synthase-like glycosyltransferase
MTEAPAIVIAVFAHNEAALISGCLRSLPSGDVGIAVHVLVNGSTDNTAALARATAPNAVVHDYAEGGKARSWNRFMFDEIGAIASTHVFVDGDTVVAPGAIAALVDALARDGDANAVGGVPLNGRNAAVNQYRIARDHGLFGALYAVRGSFLQRMKDQGVRMPEDLIGDDGLIGALVKTDLGPDRDWVDARVQTARNAGFTMRDAFRVRNPATWPMQYRRMINYSVRHFQNRIISAIMRDTGPSGLPRRLADLYGEWLPRFMPRRSLRWGWFDRLALKRMSAAAEQDRGHRAPDRARSGAE